MVKEAGLTYLETTNRNQNPLENTFGVIRLHCGSNNNPTTVGQFVYALKTSIINGIAFRDLRNTVRMIRVSYWTIYIHSYRKLMYLQHIYTQTMVLKQMVFLFIL